MMKKFKNWSCWWLHNSVNILKSAEVYIFNGWIVWYLNYISIKLLKRNQKKKKKKKKRKVEQTGWLRELELFTFKWSIYWDKLILHFGDIPLHLGEVGSICHNYLTRWLTAMYNFTLLIYWLNSPLRWNYTFHCVVPKGFSQPTLCELNWHQEVFLYFVSDENWGVNMVQANLRDILDLIPDHHKKANIAIKQVTWIFWFFQRI